MGTNSSEENCCDRQFKSFRMKKDVSLIVPEVNGNDIGNYKKTNIIANPNCSTAQLVMALKPLHDKFKIKRVVVSTYQAVSGAGKAPMDELFSQTKNILNGRTKDQKILLNKSPLMLFLTLISL